jgi:antitoxin (DNA-binding transcriptional repressor) of toxin-antitoxin stability system
MGKMRSVTVREVCREFSRKVEAPLRRGETLILRKRKEVLGRIVPERAEAMTYPDFEARRKKIFGDRVLDLNVAEILREERNRF